MISWIGAWFLIGISRNVAFMAQQSLGVIRNTALSDDSKELALREFSLKLFKSFIVIMLGGAGAFLIPTGLVWLGDKFGWISLSSVLNVTISPQFLMTSAVVATMALIFPRRKKVKPKDYSALDRTLHQIAFKTTAAQVALADLEDRLYEKQLAKCKADQPVFISALPRAGTTLLLESCVKLGGFASHCYRDMPFVLIPCLWSRFSSRFQQSGRLRERAHGDGMLINYDSPEALEEVIWKSFWRKHYQNDRIIPWQNEKNEEFTDFYRSHMKKIILLRGGQNASGTRYLSKNNLNIARTRMLRRLFPQAVIIVPFRQPLHHASSLLQQHLNFLRIHQEDPFASEYMRAIGHYDFGNNLCPVDFGGWFDRRQCQDTQTLAFWVEYWVAAYKHLLAESEGLYFFSYEGLCADPNTGLKRLAELLGNSNTADLKTTAAELHAPRAREIDDSSIPPSILEQTHGIYHSLREKALH